MLPVGGAAPRTFAPGGKNPRAAMGPVQQRCAVGVSVFRLISPAGSNWSSNEYL